MEINQIYNRELRQDLGNTSISILMQNELIKEEELRNLAISVGYMFTTDEGQIEALFNISCGEKSFYFAAQKGKLMLVNINRKMYEQTISYMESCHECLKSAELPETDAQKKRREKNNKIIRKKGIVTADKLMSLWKDEDVTVKRTEDICRRAIACLLTVQIACDIAKNNYEEGLQFFKPLYQKYDVANYLNSKEKKILEGSFSEQDVIDMDWAYEAYWALCWCLGLVRDISHASKICDCDKAISFVIRARDQQDFIYKCRLRTVKEILDMQDLYHRYHWAVNDSKVNPDSAIGKINPSIVIERRRALEWILSQEEDWYDIPLNA